MNRRTLRAGVASGRVIAPPSKSDLHRLLVAAALCGSAARVDCGTDALSEDIAATQDCLRSLLDAQSPSPALDCRESGSTLRFLLPLAAALGKTAHFTGTGRLPERPLEPLLTLLRTHGVQVEGDRLPLRISGQLQVGKYALPGNISSQYLTGLLFALPLLEGDSVIQLTSPLESAGYVTMTMRTLRRFGVRYILDTPESCVLPGGQRYHSAETRLTPEGDWSNAAFWLAAGALTGEITLAGLSADSAQPDAAILPLLRRMGAIVEANPAGEIRVCKSSLRGAELDASECPDLVPTAAVLMALAQGESRIHHAARLRLKESDRLAAMAQNLHALGAQVEELPDGLLFHGVPQLRGGAVQSFADHRIAMAMAVAALRAQGETTLGGAESVRKSYPAFWEIYDRLLAAQ
ncbi:MAG: 3-phosphoshikimate 1-carboxyvinyltransferase [Oscillospiraceae bacterium]|jgi:3-phosphoshikimate 1-carboxyvinyltransferase|nr:3-phosphoshikimate 1-carboxyvinyltransferase [Oscillospiraceae bacterium]